MTTGNKVTPGDHPVGGVSTGSNDNDSEPETTTVSNDEPDNAPSDEGGDDAN